MNTLFIIVGGGIALVLVYNIYKACMSPDTDSTDVATKDDNQPSAFDK